MVMMYGDWKQVCLKMNFEEQFAWQDQKIEQVASILGKTFFIRSSFKQDVEEATDLIVLESANAKYAVRLRKYDVYGDKYINEFTIRNKTKYGNKTEIHKILNGFGDYMFYGWYDDISNKIKYWSILDLNIFRIEINELIIDATPNIKNKDGTGFFSFNFNSFTNNLIYKTNRI